MKSQMKKGTVRELEKIYNNDSQYVKEEALLKEVV